MNDIIVIGGGIAGISAAARLAPFGRITVLERESALGYHASGRSAALYEENYGCPSVRALNRASHAYHKSENGGYLSPRGLLLLARAQDLDVFRAECQTMALDAVSISEALDMVPVLNPDTLLQAGYHAGAQDIDTDRMIQDFARVVRANGGRLLTSHAVTHISRQNNKWRIRCGDEEYSANKLVNAAGAWADQISQLAGIKPVGITPFRRSVARIPAPGDLDISTWPIFFGTGEAWYAKPDAGKLLVSPADEDPVEPHDAWADDMVLAEGLARYDEMVTTPVTRLETSWAGLRSFAPDRTLVLGPDPDQPDFIWCAGQGGYGFQTAPAASRLLADLVIGRTPELDPETVAALTPERLRR